MADTEVSIIPTLDGGPDEILTTPEQNLAYLVRHLLYAPGSTSSIYEDQLLSFRKLEAQHHSDRSGLIDAIKRQLQAAVQRRYDNTYVVDVSSYNSGGDTFGLYIDIKERATGISAIPSTAFIVENNSLRLDTSYKG